MFVPAGTSRGVIARLNAELRSIVDDAQVKAQLGAIGFDAFSSTPDELGRLVESELAHWREIIKDAGIEPQ
jgi:tripartite-type tricarboxylate transporter receptor subunit TctC